MHTCSHALPPLTVGPTSQARAKCQWEGSLFSLGPTTLEKMPSQSTPSHGTPNQKGEKTAQLQGGTAIETEDGAKPQADPQTPFTPL